MITVINFILVLVKPYPLCQNCNSWALGDSKMGPWAKNRKLTHTLGVAARSPVRLMGLIFYVSRVSE